jgi:NAD-dependent deacetylase
MQKCEFHQSLAFPEQYDFDCNYKSMITTPIQLGDSCPKCGGQLRPDIVWFGEPVDMREEFLTEQIHSADIFIGVGTSAQVYPAAGLLPMFRRTKEKYFIDPHPNYDLLDGYTVLKGSASEQLPKLVTKLL